MDEAENEVEQTILRDRWLRLREAERKRQPLAVQRLEGPCSVQQIIDAYGGIDAFLNYGHKTEDAA